jgi:hypothetical protein
MTPQKLAKIRALASDLRGDPATRMIALEILRRYEKIEEPAFHDIPDEPQNPPNPRMRNSDEYEHYMFMSLRNWGKSANGNFVHTFTHKNRAYRVVLFKHKKTPTYGWLLVDIARGVEEWSERFNSMPAAHVNAWARIMMI